MSATAGNFYTTKSGEMLPLVPISQVDLVPIYNRINAQRPQPPKETLPSGQTLINEHHPDYLAALKEFDGRNGLYAIAVTIEFGVDLELTHEQHLLVERRRAKRKKIDPTAPENEFDIFLYVSGICPTMEELAEISAAINALNTPTGEQVQAHLDTFRPDVSGNAGTENQNTLVGSGVAIG